MIYLGSYFEPKQHIGLKVQISRSKPKGFKVDHKLNFFTPSAALLKWYKAQDTYDESVWSQYTDRFRAELAANKETIFEWLKQFCPYARSLSSDMTLLCWEKAGNHCHRYLVDEFVIKRYAPSYSGGDANGAIAVGDSVEWPWMPDYLYAYCNMPLRVRDIIDSDEGEIIRLSQIDKDIPRTYIRKI